MYFKDLCCSLYFCCGWWCIERQMKRRFADMINGEKIASHLNGLQLSDYRISCPESARKVATSKQIYLVIEKPPSQPLEFFLSFLFYCSSFLFNFTLLVLVCFALRSTFKMSELPKSRLQVVRDGDRQLMASCRLEKEMVLEHRDEGKQPKRVVSDVSRDKRKEKTSHINNWVQL